MKEQGRPTCARRGTQSLGAFDLRRLSGIFLALVVLTACARPASSGQSTPSPTPSNTTASPLTAPTESPATGLGIALKATGTVDFQSHGFSHEYQLSSASNPSNLLALESHQAALNLGVPSEQQFTMTVIGGGAPGVTLKGPNEIVAAFGDLVEHVGGIATVGQGECTLALTRFGTDGLAGRLDCENVAALMGAAGPVSFQASVDAVPA